MAVEVVLPMLGITVEKGKILRWAKSEGDAVQKGEILFEVETDKVVTEVESPATGVLARILVSEELEVPVLTVVALITEEGEAVPETYGTASSPEPTPPRAADSRPEPPPSPPPAGRTPQEWDVAVIGAGPGGYVAAIRAAQLGGRVLLVEKDQLGGTCLNRGCIPTKSFLADLKPYQRVRSSDVFANGSAVSVDLPKLVARKDRVVETMKRGVARLLESRNVRFVRGTGELLDRNRLRVASAQGEELFFSKNVVIATGSRPAPLPTIRPDGKRILSSDDVVDLREIPRDILIIGGGVVGVEFATIFRCLGTKVTILEMLPRILPSEDEEVVRGLSLILQRDAVQIHTGASVAGASLRKGNVEVVVEREGRQEVFSAEKVLLAAGRMPHTEGLGLERIGVGMEGKFVRVNRRMETSVDGVYAIGDVIGKMMLAHAASAEGIAAVENILGRSREVDYGKIPSCVYTFPEVASVGLKEAEARAQGYSIQVGKFPYLSSGKAMAMGEPEGFVKIIAERELGQILGVHILGEHATDLIGECLLAMKVEASVEDLGEVVKGHPTLSEAVTEAALDWQDLAIHLPGR